MKYKILHFIDQERFTIFRLQSRLRLGSQSQSRIFQRNFLIDDTPRYENLMNILRDDIL